jgi:hypothetical protein
MLFFGEAGISSVHSLECCGPSRPSSDRTLMEARVCLKGVASQYSYKGPATQSLEVSHLTKVEVDSTIN